MKKIKFYLMDSKLSSSTIQVHSNQLGLKSVANNVATGWNLIKGIYSGISFPIVFHQKYGYVLKDVLDTGWPSLYLISNKFKNVLEENQLFGWRTFDIEIFNIEGKEISGYCGLSIIGRSAAIEYDKSSIIEKSLVINAPLNKYYKGLHIDFDTWDQSDFFLPENYFGIIVTQKAFEILKINKIENLKFENIEEIETDIDVISIDS